MSPITKIVKQALFVLQILLGSCRASAPLPSSHSVVLVVRKRCRGNPEPFVLGPHASSLLSVHFSMTFDYRVLRLRVVAFNYHLLLGT